MAQVMAFSWRWGDEGPSQPGEEAGMDGLAGSLVDRQAREEDRLVLQALWPAGVKVEQSRQRRRLRNAVGVEDPDPVEALLKSVGEAGAHRAAGAEIFGVANDTDLVRKGTVQGGVARCVVDDEHGIG